MLQIRLDTYASLYMTIHFGRQENHVTIYVARPGPQHLSLTNLEFYDP